MTPPLELAVILVAIAVLVILMASVPLIARILIRLIYFLVPAAVAAGGIAMLMNDETIFEKPGAMQRIARFVTMNSAAASIDGYGSMTCNMGVASAPAPTPASSETEAEPKRHAETRTGPNQPPRRTRLEPIGEPAPLNDIYPELIRRSYPGIPRIKLFQLSLETVNSLGGWKIVKADPGNATVDCIYTSRIFKFEDDVRIAVEPSGEIDVCSRSGMARPGVTSILRYFPGDFGANIGHIKQFYEALEPKMDEVYKEEQERQNARQPH